MIKKPKHIVKNTLVYGSATLICVYSVFPILWAISTSLKTDTAIYTVPPEWIPDPLIFDNYISVFNNPDMITYFRNTTIVAVASTIMALVIGILGAYGFSRYKFPGAKTLLISIMFTRILPRIALVIPYFITLKNLGLYNTKPGLILAYLMVTMPLSVWLLKGFFDGVPYEIEESAIIDGCTPWQVLWRVVVPIIRPGIAAVGMNAFILAWNEFIFALILTNGKEMRTISVGLAFYIDEFGIRWGELMAASVVMCIPAAVMFAFFQKNLISGLADGAIKG